MIFLDQKVSFVLKKQYRETVKAVVAANPLKYDSEGHFYRVAVLNLLRHEDNEKPDKQAKENKANSMLKGK